MTKRRSTRQPGEKGKPTKPAIATTSRDARSDEESVGANRPVILQIRGRPALRREIKRSADELGVTAQTFALMALREYGVGVTEEDLLDLRKGENRASRSGIRKVDGPAAAADQIRRLCDLAAATSSRGRGAGSGRNAGDGGVTVVFNVYSAKPDP